MSNYINDWGIPVRGYESAMGGLYHSEAIALAVSGEGGPTHSLVRFIDCFDAFEALEHIMKYDSEALGAIGLSLAKSALSNSRRAKANQP